MGSSVLEIDGMRTSVASLHDVQEHPLNGGLSAHVSGQADVPNQIRQERFIGAPSSPFIAGAISKNCCNTVGNPHAPTRPRRPRFLHPKIRPSLAEESRRAGPPVKGRRAGRRARRHARAPGGGSLRRANANCREPSSAFLCETGIDRTRHASLQSDPEIQSP